MAPNQTLAFLGDPATWTSVRVSLDNVHGLWGGRRITVEGTGHTSLEMVPPAGGGSEPVAVTLTPDEVQRLLIGFIEHDFLTLAIEPPPMVIPDAIHTKITLVNAEGEQHSAGCWSGGARDVRFEKLAHVLLEIEVQSQPLAP